MFQVERLHELRSGAPSVRNVRVGRSWRKIGPTVKRHKLAASIAEAVRNAGAIVRIRHIAATR